MRKIYQLGGLILCFSLLLLVFLYQRRKTHLMDMDVTTPCQDTFFLQTQQRIYFFDIVVHKKKTNRPGFLLCPPECFTQTSSGF